MKCPIDQTEMEKGSLFNNGNAWTNKQSETLMKVVATIGMAKTLFAYRCSKCGKVELTTEAK